MTARRRGKEPGDEASRPEPDQQPGAPHPRQTFGFVGHEEAEAELAKALAGGRLHHAWLIAGPQGLGKATLAYRAARILLGARRQGPRPLDVSAEDPVARRVSALGHGDLFVLRRSYDGARLRREITVEDARALSEFLALTAAEGGYRVGVVDAVDDLNRNAANALLKGLEEPPPRTVLFLIAHAPGRVLPTIRSRCRRLTLRPLGPDAVAEAASQALGRPLGATVANLAKGRPGRAIALQASEAEAMVAAVQGALERLHSQGGAAIHALAFARDGDTAARLTLAVDLLSDWIDTAVRARAGAPDGRWTADQDRLAQRLMPDIAATDRWARAWAELGALMDVSEGLNMDPIHAYTRIGTILEEAAGPRA